MSDRANTITVVLERDIRVDDLEEVLSAIKMTKYVLDAKPNVADHTEYMAYSRARRELGAKLWNVLKEE